MTNNLQLKTKPRTSWAYGFMILFFVFTGNAIAQDLTVKGKVIDENGLPLPGVNVIIQNTNTGASTDFDGFYSINAPSNSVLEFSYLGYVNQSIPVNGRTTINATLKEDISQLDEVVVVGYGSMERSNVAGSIVTVSSETLDRIPVPNAIEALRGQAAGVQITRGSGQPGSGVSFRIRGNNSLGATSDVTGANTPLIVIDGVPSVGGNLNEINPDDIESINILKDAASSAIYGSSGANGVVLITTKQGKIGKTNISANFSTGFVNVANKINFMNADEYVKYRLDIANTTSLTGAGLDPVEVGNYVNGNSVDWQDLLLRSGIQNNISLSANGGSEKFTFYLNGDVFQEDGIITNSDYKRYSFRLNSEMKATDWLTIGARVQLTKSEADETANAITEFNLNGGFAPFIPISNNSPLGSVYNEDGSTREFINSDRFQINPLHRYNESVLDRFVTRSYVNPYVDVKLFDGLSYRINSFVEERREFYGRFQSEAYNDSQPSEAQIQQTKTNNYLFDNILNYKKDFGKHGLDVTLVYGFQQYFYEQSNMIAENLIREDLSYNVIGYSQDDDSRIDWNRDDWGRTYQIARLGYDFDGKYIFTGSIRRDGSSRFGPNFQYGYFPSASLAWNAHQENFWGDNSKLDLLKLRLSYGELGNDQPLGTYLYRAEVIPIQVQVGVDDNGTPDDPADDIPIIFNGLGKSTRGGNPNLKWEESRQLNIGVDFGFFNNRLSGSIDLYQTNTVDILLLEQIIPTNSGYETFASNIGESENKGIEINLRGDVIRAEDFSWNINANWAKNKEEIVKLSRGDVDEEGNPVPNLANNWFPGQPASTIFTYKSNGVWQLDEAEAAAEFGFVPGDPKIEDINGDGAITDDDRTHVGNAVPDWYGGITNTFSYKGFELSVLFEAVQGVERINNFIEGYNGRNNEIVIDYWTPDNPTNAYPSIGAGSQLAGGLFQNAVRVEDASFVALRNVSLGYTLPSKFLEKTPFSNLSFYLRGNNLKYWTDYDNAWSPESSVGAYPITKIWTFGTKITF